MSRVFRPVEGRDRPDEPLLVGALITRGEERRLWQPATAPPLYLQAKGIAERLLTRLGYVASLRGGPVEPFLHPEMTAAVEVDDQVIGAIGEVHPAVAASFGIEVSCAALEIDLSALSALARKTPRYAEVSRFPQMRRDIAVILESAQPAGEVLDAIRKSAGRDLLSAELFDRYEGKGVPKGI